MNCKKAIMGFAALLILFYHFYIPFGTEGNIFAFAYFGVDLFFFVSAYSLGKREKIKFLSFMGNRFISIYIPFLIMAVISYFYKNWKIEKLLKVLCGIDFFEKSGGAFLWYLIAIMFLYLLVPFFSWFKSKLKIFSLFILLIVWLSIIFILEYGLNYTNIFILLTRLPVFFIGFFYDDIKQLCKIKNVSEMKTTEKIISIIISLILITIGIILIQFYGTKIRLNKPFTEIYYLFAIFPVIGFIELFNLLNDFYKPVVLGFIGTITLEIYGFQMIFGYNFESWLLKSTKELIKIDWIRKTTAFTTTLLFIILIAYIFHFLYNLIKSFFLKKQNN